MIVNEEIFVNITNINRKYYKSKGYILNDDMLKIKLLDLPLGSHIKISVKCMNCNIVKSIIYKNYITQTKNHTEKYYCTKCKNIKIKNTLKERYGEDSIFKLKEYQIKNKKIMLEKYGVESALMNNNIKNKMINTLKEKYNVDNVSKLKNIKEKKKKTLSESWIFRLRNKHKDLNIISGNYENKIIKIDCDQNKNHTFNIKYDLLYNRKEIKSILCTKCHKIGRTIFGIEDIFYNFIKNNYNGKIIKNDRQKIKPYELDIYLPDLKLAFEFNGFNWHNELNKDKNYHLMKTELCEKQNIQLIHIYEDDWIYKQDIVKSMILNKLSKNPNKIYARKTEIKEITDNKLVRGFLNENHIQGFVGSSIKLGLFFENELVSLMTFGKTRKPLGQKYNEKLYEMLRFCNKLNTNVIGGASKLFKYFIKKYDFKNIITYADRSHSNGKLYEIIGFNFIYKTKPNYHYIIDGIKQYRFGFRKDILVKKGFNKNKTEHEIMLERGIYRIYNSGNLKYIYENLI